MVTTWIANRLEGVLRQGRTKPLILYCTPADTEESPGKGDQARSLVVKAEGLPEVGPENLFNEFVGNLLARRLGIATPEPAFVLLTDEFVSAVSGELANLGLRLQPGIGAGTTYISGLANVVVGSAPSAEELEHMTLIYGFDMLAQNPDRRHDNPNCASKGGNLLAYDFDMCFSFLLALGNPDHPCAISQHGICRNHCFWPTLYSKKATVSWKTLCDQLSSTSEADLVNLTTCVPVTWQKNAVRVQGHLKAICNDLRSASRSNCKGAYREHRIHISDSSLRA